MAAEVSNVIIRVLAGYKEEDNRTAVGSGQKSTAPVTRDFLGQSSNLAAATADLKSGKTTNSNEIESKFPPSPSKRTLNLFNETTQLDLKLPSSSLTNYASVCTLDKVKSALERTHKAELVKKRSSSSEIRDTAAAVGCPGCLSYVMVMKNNNPCCPRCNSALVPLPTIKKPRIDLNMSI